jgi:MarR family transcriptional regulator for hemolysin
MQKRRQQLRNDFASLVARAARQWRRAVDRRLQPFGLTEATWLPLIYLARAPVPMRQKDLADALALDGSTVVRLLDALEASELVERQTEQGDRRARIIVPTRRGLSIVEQVEAVSREVRNATLTGLSDGELEIATRVLDQVCRNLAKQQDERA